MRTVGLISGGKDSIYNLMHCIAQGHEIVALAHLNPKNDEQDSFMFQSVGHELVDAIAECLQLPLYRIQTLGTSKQVGKIYHVEKGDEVEDLLELLTQVKLEMNAQAVSVGAILSNYQRVRVENV